MREKKICNEENRKGKKVKPIYTINIFMLEKYIMLEWYGTLIPPDASSLLINVLNLFFNL